MERIDPFKDAARLCNEIMSNATKSTAKTYNHLFIESCLPLLSRRDLEESLKKRIIHAQKKLDLLQRPPLHPGGPSLPRATPSAAASAPSKPSPPSTHTIECSTREEALMLYEIVKFNLEHERSAKNDLLIQVIHSVCIDDYFNANPPYPDHIDIASPILVALQKLALLGIYLTDPEKPSWADYKPNALKELDME